MFGGYGLEQRIKNLDADVLRQNSLEKLLWRLLVDVIDRRRRDPGSGLVDGAGIDWTHTDSRRLRRFDSLFAFLWRTFFRHEDVDFADLLDRRQALGDEALRDARLEFVEENVDAVNL